MAFQTVFKRYELKYLLTQAQKQAVLAAMEPYMELDAYGRTTIRNIYYDTENYRLVRRSIEAPVYKEKLRVRSYAQAARDSTVFVELKKKHDSVVYKRRLPLAEGSAMAWLSGRQACPSDTQIGREIQYFTRFYQSLHPSVFLTYEREAYYTREQSDFRVTFDDRILCRQEDISLQAPVWGTPILPEGVVLMEIKCSGGIPLWMTGALSQNGIRKTSFSKYGTAYQSLIYPKIKCNAQEVMIHD